MSKINPSNDRYLGFMKEFEAVKIVFLEEIMKADNPEKLIDLGRGLQEEADRLRIKEEILRNSNTEIFNKGMGSAESFEDSSIVKEDEIRESVIKTVPDNKEVKKEVEANILKKVEIPKDLVETDKNEKPPVVENISLGKIAPLNSGVDLSKTVVQSVSLNNESNSNKTISEKTLPIKEEKEPMADIKEVKNLVGNEIRNNISPDKMREIVEGIVKSDDGAEMLIFLGKFENKSEIIAQPEVMEAFKKSLIEGMHFYDVDKLVGIPGIPKELFESQEVQIGVLSSLKSFVMHQNEASWNNISSAVDRIVSGAKISDNGLRSLAEELKGNPESYRLFVDHFGVKRIYPDLAQ